MKVSWSKQFLNNNKDNNKILLNQSKDYECLTAQLLLKMLYHFFSHLCWQFNFRLNSINLYFLISFPFQCINICKLHQNFNLYQWLTFQYLDLQLSFRLQIIHLYFHLLHMFLLCKFPILIFLLPFARFLHLFHPNVIVIKDLNHFLFWKFQINIIGCLKESTHQ